MSKFLGLAFAGLTAFSVSAMAQQAQPIPQRVRGTVEAVNGNTFTVRSRDGKDVKLMIGSDTKFASVLPGSLSEVKPGDFIGTATKGPESDMVALEVVIFPNSMRGTGEGHYPWDKLPNTESGTESTGSGPQVQSSMTNGTVQTATSANNGPMVQTAMTNGTVAADTSKTGGKELTVTFKGQKAQVLVPPDVPVVTFAPGQRSLVQSGAKVFIVAIKPSGSSELDAKFVAVGKNGLTPPM